MGLDRAGKTSLIRRITEGEFNTNITRTMGMNVDKIRVESDKNLELVSWDVGGQIHFRNTLWSSYMQNTSAIIFVVDSSNEERFDEAREEIWKYILGEDGQQFDDIPLLVLANKQDLSTAVNPGVLANALDLHKIKRASFMIMPVSALTGFNVIEALDWLADRIIKLS